MIRVSCICEECGNTFLVHPYRAETARYCSTLCKNRFEGRARRGKPALRVISGADLFWTRVLKTTPEACWIWQGHKDKDGYGHFQLQGVNTPAHRAAYILTHGSVPPEMYVCHNCPDGDNPACVNPAHLWLGTQRDNVQDSIRKGRRRLPSNTKLTQADHQEICRLYDPNGYGQVSLAQRFGVSQATIWRILRKHNLNPGRGYYRPL